MAEKIVPIIIDGVEVAKVRLFNADDVEKVIITDEDAKEVIREQIKSLTSTNIIDLSIYGEDL